jgi:histone arginine demethylase JMJD6
VCELPLDESNPVKREHASDLTVERFINEYETPYVPVVIEGVPEAEGWGAAANWTLKVGAYYTCPV